MTINSERVRTGHGGRPTRAISVQISRRILDAAAELFLRDGSGQTSMDAVAAGAGLSKRTLYTRFPTKADLFEAVVVDVLDADLRAFERAPLASGSLREQLLEFAGRLLAIALTPKVVGLERIGPVESRQFPELTAHLQHRFRHQVFDLLCDLMRRFEPMGERDDGALRKDAEIFISMVILPPLRKAVLSQDTPSFDNVDRALVERAVDIFVKGIQG